MNAVDLRPKETAFYLRHASKSRPGPQWFLSGAERSQQALPTAARGFAPGPRGLSPEQAPLTDEPVEA